MLAVLPRKAAPGLSKAYQDFASAMQRMGPGHVAIQWDDELDTLPGDLAVTLLGWENRHLDSFKAASSGYGVEYGSDGLILNNKTIPYANNSIALTVRRKNEHRTPLSFIATDTIKALPGLARKLPHYHKYSYVAFSGTEPVNHTKGRWPVTGSPMTQFFVEKSQRGLLKRRRALAEQAALFNAAR